MMNRSSSAEAYVPSMMSFVGLEGSSQKQHPWDWETTSHNPHTAIPAAAAVPAAAALPSHVPFFPNPPFLDCPPPLLPMNAYPFYSSPAVPDYPGPAGLVKREDGVSTAGVGGGRIGLNLGHRTYFSSGDALTIDRLFARSRGVYSLSHQPPRCQAEGCKADLSGAKHYHRRHKVCEFHSKATVVIAGGLQQRFCQQCSRFHVLSEFDEAKRSCRKRLADHNRRRRKPQLSAAGSSDSSTSKNPTSNSMDKSKQAPKTTRDISTSKPTASISCANSTLEGQQGHQSNATHPRNGPALSLGGVGAVERGGLRSHSHPMYQQPYVAMAEEKASQQQQQQPFSSPSSGNSTYFHQHNLFSSSNEASQSTGGGSDHTTHNLLHLGQAMFEVDFM